MRIVTNPVFMPQAIAECIMLFTVSGMIAFSPKYIETQFFLPAWKVNILIGNISFVAIHIYRIYELLTLCPAKAGYTQPLQTV